MSESIMQSPTYERADLAEKLAELKVLLRRQAAQNPTQTGSANGVPHRIASAPTLNALGDAFDLSQFERDLLFLCAGIELDSEIAPLCAAAQGDPARTYPTFSLALAALTGAHWSALSPGRPLRHWRLLEVGAGPALTVSPLRIDERVLHHLVGVPYLDERLAALIEPLVPADADELASSHSKLAERVAAVWSGSGGRAALVQLCGPEAADRRAVAWAAAAALGMRVAVLPAELVPTAASEFDVLIRLWERESVLSGAVLVVECDDLDAGADPHRARTIRRLADRIAGMVILSDRERRPIAHRPMVAFDVLPPTPSEQRAVWQASLGSQNDIDAQEVDILAGQFSLGLPAIRSAAAESIARAAASAAPELGRTAWDVCRKLCRNRLGDLAQRIEPSAGWDDLVLPGQQADAVRRIAQHVRHRGTVHDTWGFAAKSGRGLGINALFAGASGTGKTMAAEVLANELRLDLYRIDLAGVVSKYIGESEKNLRKVFDAAEGSGAILLFDEADALFGKRSEVKDSHDRYANIEVSYLLQRMEAYRGLAILTSNLKNALDSAFLRRIRFVVQFPFPDVSQRAEIWRRVFPASTPTEGLDVWKLAKLNVPGGNIRNIALNAAFLAADDRTAVRMGHIRSAAAIEYAKLERPLTDAEIGGWS